MLNMRVRMEDQARFLSDESLHLNGYQVSLASLEKGLLLFTHMTDNCKTTMGVYVTDFSDIYTGVRYRENKSLSAECPRYCIEAKRLDRCDVACECAFVREIIQMILNYPEMGND